MYFRYATAIRSYLKLVLNYKFLFWGTFLSDVVHLHEQGRKNPRLDFETKGVREPAGMVNSQLCRTLRDTVFGLRHYTSFHHVITPAV